MAFAVNTLILENNIICGGVSGVANSVETYLGIPVSLVVAIINIFLFGLGFFSFGKEFAMTTLLSTFLFPAFLELFNSLPFLHGYISSPFFAMILGGCLSGFGIGLVLKANASTGGVDILALFLHKKIRIPVHIALNIIDVTILVLQLSFSSTVHIIYGIIMTFIVSFVLKITFAAGKNKKEEDFAV